jgi:hypothetical protein
MNEPATLVLRMLLGGAAVHRCDNCFASDPASAAEVRMLFGGAAVEMLLGAQRLRIGERPMCPHFRRMRRLFRILGLQPRILQHAAKRSLPTRSTLSVNNLSIPIDDHINGIGVGGIHGGQIGIAG